MENSFIFTLLMNNSYFPSALWSELFYSFLVSFIARCLLQSNCCPCVRNVFFTLFGLKVFTSPVLQFHCDLFRRIYLSCVEFRVYMESKHSSPFWILDNSNLLSLQILLFNYIIYMLETQLSICPFLLNNAFLCYIVGAVLSTIF